MIFWLVLKLEISYKVPISRMILVCFERLFEDFFFFHGELFEFS
jgi:hypothetical protein